MSTLAMKPDYAYIHIQSRTVILPPERTKYTCDFSDSTRCITSIDEVSDDYIQFIRAVALPDQQTVDLLQRFTDLELERRLTCIDTVIRAKRPIANPDDFALARVATLARSLCYMDTLTVAYYATLAPNVPRNYLFGMANSKIATAARRYRTVKIHFAEEQELDADEPAFEEPVLFATESDASEVLIPVYEACEPLAELYNVACVESVNVECSSHSASTDDLNLRVASTSLLEQEPTPLPTTDNSTEGLVYQFESEFLNEDATDLVNSNGFRHDITHRGNKRPCTWIRAIRDKFKRFCWRTVDSASALRDRSDELLADE